MRADPPPDDLFDERPVIRWYPSGGGALVGSGAGGRRYRVRRSSSRATGWWEERPGTDVGCGGSGPYRTLAEARQRAEARERNALARRRSRP